MIKSKSAKTGKSNITNGSKITTRATGQQTEQLACDYLMQQGLQCLEKNYHSKLGEIDLIMRDNQVIVFVEVRYRKRSSYGGSAETVVPSKRAKIIKTALYYLMKNKLVEKVLCRFDVVAISPGEKAPKIDWIKDAFQAQ